MPDITALIMDDHEWFRRRFAELDDAREKADLDAIWQPLAARLDTHAKAEETIFYPHLLKHADPDAAETEDAVRDHNKIRSAVADAARCETGSAQWHDAVQRARTENSEHLQEEEDGALPDFRKHSKLELRHELGAQWIRFYAAHPMGIGISSAPVDVDRYIDQRKP